MTQLASFKALEKKLAAYQYVLNVVGWDSSTEAPKGAFKRRADMQSIISQEAFELWTSDEYRELLEALLNDSSLSELDQKSLQKAHKALSKVNQIPADEYAAYNKLLTLAQRTWEDAKANDDYESFKPTLGKIIETQKKLIAYRGETAEPYNVLLDDFEEGMTMEKYDAFFDVIRKDLVPFVQAVLINRPEKPAFIDRHFPKAGQKAYVKYLNEVFDYDLDKGLLKESVHPFTWNTHPSDVRYTVRYLEDFVFSSIFAGIHELGHATYEMGIDEALNDTRLKGGTSMGIHESQSRFYENVIGRSKAFWEVHYPKLKSLFPDALKDVDVDTFYLGINWVEQSFIRVEADELTYPLHIMIRYECERAIFNEGLSLDELPDVWNQKVKDYLSLTVEKDTDGLLQDVHWSGGAFGYFPTYALGSAYAAQIYYSMRKELDLDAVIKANDIPKINAWLKDKIHRFGKRKSPEEVLLEVTGEPFDAAYYIRYLKEKYSPLYLK